MSECDGIERSPNRCRCACEGCKHHCGAHVAPDSLGPQMVTFLHDGKPLAIPDPRDPHSVEDRLRGGMVTPDDMVYAATVMVAYREIFQWPQQRRNRLIRRAKEVMGWPTPLAGGRG